MNDYDPHQQYQESGLHRAHSIYGMQAASGGQFGQHHHLYSHDFSQWQAAANHPGYTTSAVRSAYTSGAGGFMSHPGLAGRFSPSMMSGQATSLVQTSGSGMSTLGSQLMPAHQATGGLSLGMNGGVDLMSGSGQHYHGMNAVSHHPSLHGMHDHNRSEISNPMKLSLSGNPPPASKSKKSHIKKPLNAFMLFMKEMRASVVAECSLKESAAINQILGRKWHALSREAQAKYYEMARKEKELHLQLYPGWSARDNYATHSKRKKSAGGGAVVEPLLWGKECALPKKCRSKYVLDPSSVIWSKQSNMITSDSFPLTASPSHSQSSYESLANHQQQAIIGMRGNTTTTATGYESSPLSGGTPHHFLHPPPTSIGVPEGGKLLTQQYTLRCPPPLQLGIPVSSGCHTAYTELQPLSAASLQRQTDLQNNVTLTQLS